MNLLRSFRINPRLSAEEQMNGTFNYHTTPLAPLGIKVLAYELPTHRALWAEHGKEGWYIGPARDHYQCYKILIKSKKRIRIPPKVAFFPERTSMPTNSSTDRLLQAAKDLTHAINNPTPSTPFEHIGNKETTSLKKLAKIFQNKIQQKQNNTKKKINIPQRVVETIQRVTTKQYPNKIKIKINN